VYSLKDCLELLKEFNGDIQRVDSNALELADSLIPLGFIYVQLPNQPEPAILWPNYNYVWENISDSYAGAFFRAEGGLANKFEKQAVAQEESVPNIKGNFNGRQLSDENVGNGSTASGAFIVGGAQERPTPNSRSDSKQYGFSFDASRSSPAYGRRSEVAPANYTIRIWQRAKP
jgi:hypothetical protein